jgi:S-adenosyl-L-methionine hydrolase (adenosine-forming)
MSTHSVLTLLTDFGTQDTYAGVIKGIIAQIAPTAMIVDLTHHIPPQNIAAARFNLMVAYPHFPKGTVHVAVVDPGVGSTRRAIALQLADGFLVGPDNGIFSGVLSQYPVLKAVELTNRQYWNTQSPSHTFHGRDIFAPVGAHLANDVAIDKLGPAIAPETLVVLSLPECTQTDHTIRGCIQYVDHFGNLITNIPGHLVEGKSWSARIDSSTIPGVRTYTDLPVWSLLALVGSHGWVEVAIHSGSAWSKLRMNWGDAIQITVQ